MVLAAVMCAAIAACGSSMPRVEGSTTTASASGIELTTVKALHDRSRAGLEAAARMWAYGYLRASLVMLDAVRDPDPDPVCSHDRQPSGAAAISEARTYLREFQREVEARVGVPAAKVVVRSVRVRNFTGSMGDAEADYGYPESIQGDANWNTYRYSHGYWHLAGCETYGPFGGQEGSSSGTVGSAST